MDASPHSAGLAARQHGQVARATHSAPGATYSKRNLPHFEKPWAIYHVIINTIAPRKLSPAARDIVFDCILHWRERRYRLVAACVMPDHAHFIIQPGVQAEDKEGNPIFWPLSEILHSIKSYSAKEVNKLDKVKGTLWQQERYDRYMRSDLDLQEKFHYVCRNPWAAGLVKRVGTVGLALDAGNRSVATLCAVERTHRPGWHGRLACAGRRPADRNGKRARNKKTR